MEDNLRYFKDKSVDVGARNLQMIEQGVGDLRFTGAYIHTDPICNFSCEGCFVHVKKKKRNRGLSLDTRKHIIDYVCDHGGDSIIFAGAGEPTVDKHYHETAKYARSKGLQVVTFTNLSTIKNIDDAKKLLEYGPVIGKLYTLDEQKYNELVDHNKAYEYAMRGFDFLLQARKELKKNNSKSYPIALDSYVSKDNYKDLPDLLRFCRERDIIPYFEAYIELGQTDEVKQKALDEQQLMKVFLQLQKIDKDEFNITTLIHKGTRSYGQEKCNKATHMPSFREDGSVTSCVCAENIIATLEPNNKNSSISEQLSFVFDPGKNQESLLRCFACEGCSKIIDPVVPDITQRNKYRNTRFNKGLIYGDYHSSFLDDVEISGTQIAVIGAGYGRNANFFADKGYVVHSIDSSENAISLGTKLYGNKSNFHFHKHDIAISSLQQSYDTIFAINFLSLFTHHEIDDVLRNIKESIKPGGYLIANFLSCNDEEYGLGILLENNTFLRDQMQIITFYENEQQIKVLLEKYGFSISSIQKVQEERDIDILGKSVLSDSYLVIAQKNEEI